MNDVKPSDDASGIDYHKGGTTIYGKDGMGYYKATILASALRLYAKARILPTRGVSARAMMLHATAITGKTFKTRDYEGAAAALTEWSRTMKTALPKTLDGEIIP